jgi:V/A-type H+-transporting ATPase subunit K
LSSAGLFCVISAVTGLHAHAFSIADAREFAASASLQVSSSPYNSLARGLAFGLAALGGGVAVGYAGSAAIAAIAEKPNLFGRAIIFVALGEGIAIYGFVIVFILPTT